MFVTMPAQDGIRGRMQHRSVGVVDGLKANAVPQAVFKRFAKASRLHHLAGGSIDSRPMAPSRSPAKAACCA